MAKRDTLLGVSFFNDLKKEFSGYSKQKFTKDLLAGLTVTAVALPLALAFGVSSGLDASSGLISAIIAGLIIGPLAGASYQISGPTGTMAVILTGLAVSYGPDAVFLVGMLSGIILLIAAVLKIGALVSYIPLPVVTGFTSGIAVIIALSQVDNFFGVTSQGETSFAKIYSYTKLGFTPDLTTVLFGMLVVVIMIFWPKKWNDKVPSSLIGIIVALILEIILDLNLKEVGALPTSLFGENRLHFSFITISNIKKFISPAISIAALIMVESLLCGSYARKMKNNERFFANRELSAQGIGNIIIPFFGGIPATSAIARTSVAIKSGGQTRLTGFINALGLLAAMFLFGPYISRVPLSALAGVLMVTAWRMNDWNAIKNIFDKKIKTSISQFSITLVATVIFDLTSAILIGIVFSMVMFVISSNKISVEVDDVTEELIKNAKKTKVIYVDGSLFFGTQEILISEVELLIKSKTKRIIFSLRGVPNIDHSSVNELTQIVKMCRDKKIKVLFCGVQPPVMKMFKRLDFIEVLGHSNFYTSVVMALESLD